MLVEVVHLPTAYQIDIAAPDITQASQANERSMALLRELGDNFLLLVDGGVKGDIYGQIDAFIQQWPQKHRDRAKNLLIHLDNQRRIVGLPVKGGGDWHDPYCRKAVALAAQTQPDGVIGPSICSCGGVCQQMAAECDVSITPLHNYMVDTRLQAKREARKWFSKAQGEPMWQEFNRDVMRPIFRHPKRVRVYDRYLGINMYEAIQKSLNNHYSGLTPRDVDEFAVERLAGRPAYLSIQESDELFAYKAFCLILFRCFSQYSLRGGTMTFHTEIRSRETRGHISSVSAAFFLLQDMVKQMQQDVDGDCECEFVAIRQSKGIDNRKFADHDRFISTDNIALMVGKGLHIMDVSGESMEAHITQIDQDAVPFRSYGEIDKRISIDSLKREMRIH